MPALKNTRHELFCIGLVSGKKQYQSYVDAGFASNEKNSSKMASLLSQKVDIKARIAELIEDRTKFQQNMVADLPTSIAKQTGEVTKEWIVTQLVMLVEESKAASQFGAANAALKMLGEHIGMFGKKTIKDDNSKPLVEETKAISVDRINKLLATVETVDVT